MKLDQFSAGELSLHLASCDGVAGQENSAAAEAEKLLSELGDCETTALGSLICRIKTAKREDAPHLVLEAHLDEIGLIVTYIEDSGFLRVAPCGGVDRQLLCASRVTVHTKNGPLHGVISSVPPHLKKGKSDTAPEIDEISVDIGLNGDAAREAVSLGDRITFDAQPRQVGKLLSCKALDDRAGCAAVLRAAVMLLSDDLDCSLSVLLSTMEELGGHGAGTGIYALAPTHAFCVDVSFGHAPGMEERTCGKLLKGPMIGIAPLLSHEISQMFIRTAQEKEIPFQYEVLGGGKTGTDADEIACSRGGIKTGLLSIPQRNMHTPVELVAEEDVENTARLLAEGAKALFGRK